MNKNIVILMLILGLMSSISCKKDEKPAKPVIILKELCYNNSKKVQIGSDLHIDAEIEAEGKINSISVEIHPETNGLTWHFDTTFNDFKGLKNVDFHKHLHIPQNAQAGEYHFHLKVSDLEDQQTIVGSPLTITTDSSKTK
jgi:hypothetical protein